MNISLRSFTLALLAVVLSVFAFFSLYSSVFSQTGPCASSNINRLNGCVYNSKIPGSGQFMGNIDSGRFVPAASVPVADSFTFLDVFWGDQGPFGLRDDFSIRWSGIFTFAPGTYRFISGSDDGMRIKIDGKTYLDKFSPRIYREDEDSFQITFCRQTTVPIELDYLEAGAIARVKARWVKVPAPFDQMQGCLWGTKDPGAGDAIGLAPAGPVAPVPVPDNFAPLEYFWGAAAPAGAPVDNFSGRWKGFFVFAPGTYRFLSGSDDGVRVRMARGLPGQAMGPLQAKVDKWQERAFTDSIFVETFAEPTIVLFEIDYFDSVRSADLLFRWDKVIPCTSRVGTNKFEGCLYDGMDSATGAVAGFALPGKVPPSSPISQAFTALDFPDAHVIATPFTGPRTFAARWSGNFTFAPGTYRFIAGSDDGMRVFLNGRQELNFWQDRPYTENSVVKTFSEETTLRIDIDYYENLFLARVNFRWEPIIDCSGSTTGFGVFKGCLYDWSSLPNPPTETTGLFGIGPASDGRALSNPVPNSAVAIDFRDGNFPRGLDKFSGVWRGVFRFRPGQYRFYAGGDDGVRVRVDLGDGSGYQTKVDRWVDRLYTEDSFVLVVPDERDIRFELSFFDRAAIAQLKFGWDPIPVCTTEVGINRLSGCLYDWPGSTPPPIPENGVPAGNAPLGPVFSGLPSFVGLDTNWGDAGTQFTGVDTFSAKWRGNFVLPAGTYRFSVGSDDGVRVKVNGVTKIDRWIPRIFQEGSDTFEQTFDGVTPTLIEIEYFEQGALARIKFGWQKL